MFESDDCFKLGTWMMEIRKPAQDPQKLIEPPTPTPGGFEPTTPPSGARTKTRPKPTKKHPKRNQNESKIQPQNLTTSQNPHEACRQHPANTYSHNARPIPPTTQTTPTRNPHETHTKPTRNPHETHKKPTRNPHETHRQPPTQNPTHNPRKTHANPHP